MADNPYVNQVVYDGDTLIDLREDTVIPSVLGAGYTAHDRTGAPVTGTAQVVTALEYTPLRIPSARPSSVEGGYAVLGNLVIINFAFETMYEIYQYGALFSGVPSPQLEIDCNNRLNRQIVLTPEGKAYLLDQPYIPAGTRISGTCVYLKR